MARTFIPLLLATALLNQGCATVADYQYTYVNKAKAWVSWRNAKQSLPDKQITRHFSKGYRAGFLDVTRGGDGTPPPVAPKEYWKVSYSCGEDRCAVDEWFHGFHCGAAEALRCGYNACYAVPALATYSQGACVESGCSLENNQYIANVSQPISTMGQVPANGNEPLVIPEVQSHTPATDAESAEELPPESIDASGGVQDSL